MPICEMAPILFRPQVYAESKPLSGIITYNGIIGHDYTDEVSIEL